MARVFISHSSRDNEAAARIKGWLQQQGFDTPFLDFDKHAGIPPGADWERTLYREMAQSEAVIIIQTGNWMDSKWCFAEFTQARALGKPIFPVIETAEGKTLIAPDIQALDLREDRQGGLERLARQLTQIALDAQGGFDWNANRAPYPGLLAFQEEDAAIYFGRDDDIRRFIERLNARRAQGGVKLLALLGASGSGKSSLLRAGVLPRLKRTGRQWIVVPPMRPQARPLDELARVLAMACGPRTDWRGLLTDLQGGDIARVLDHVAGDLRVAAGAAEAQILLSVDQAEELFGAAEPEQAKRFLEILSHAMAGDGPWIGVLAMRSDFLGELQSATALSVRFEEFSLAPMPLARIPQIIEGPARVAGLRVDDDFVQQAARDAETEDALPLLAFALRELYDRAGADHHLSLDEYRALGDAKAGLTPLENAVRRAADGVLADARPAPEDLAALREAFVPAMVRVNDQGDYVRRPARWDELPARAHALLDKLARARLLIVRQDGEARSVEVAHEALLRKWPLLRGWLDDAREFLIGRQQLERDLRDWQHAAEADKAGALLTGLKLNRARSWLVERAQQLSASERAYIQAGIDHADAAQERKLRLRRNTTRASVAAAVVLAIVAAFAGYSWVKAERAAEEAAAESDRANTAAAALEKSARERAVDIIRYAWLDLADKQAETQRLSDVARRIGQPPATLLPDPIGRKQPDGFDCNTFLEQGFRALYCSVRDIVSFPKLQSISGLKIFRPDGPHGWEVDLKSPFAFGHYDPAFLDWLEQFLVPEGRDDARFNAATRLAYDTYLGPTVRALYHSHRILFADAAQSQAFLERFDRVAREYRARLARREVTMGYFDPADLPMTLNDARTRYERRIAAREDRIGFLLQEDFRWLSDYLAADKGDDWYLANTAGGFWVRRTIDGTQAQIFRMVEKLLRAFEPSVLAER